MTRTDKEIKELVAKYIAEGWVVTACSNDMTVLKKEKVTMAITRTGTSRWGA